MWAIYLDDMVYATFASEDEADAFLVRYFSGAEGKLAVRQLPDADEEV